MLNSEFLQYLVRQNVRPGEALPTLSDISGELGVSVGKLREEVACARADGIISLKPRVGMRREPYSFLSIIKEGITFGLATGEATFEQLSELRQGIETSLWDMATAQLTAQDIAELVQCVSDARLKLAQRTIPHREHRALHLGIFKQIDNPFVTGILQAYWDVYEQSEFNRYRSIGYWEEVWNFHEQIVAALARDEREGARQLLIEHFNLLETS